MLSGSRISLWEAEWLGMAIMRGPRAKPEGCVRTTFAELLSLLATPKGRTSTQHLLPSRGSWAEQHRQSPDLPRLLVHITLYPWARDAALVTDVWTQGQYKATGEILPPQDLKVWCAESSPFAVTSSGLLDFPAELPSITSSHFLLVFQCLSSSLLFAPLPVWFSLLPVSHR